MVHSLPWLHAEWGSARGTKRKFAFDASAAEKSALEAEEAALRQIEREQAEALKAKLPDFWLPSLTPTYTTTGPPTSLQDVKVQTTCRGGNPSHHLAYALYLLPSSEGRRQYCSQVEKSDTRQV